MLLWVTLAAAAAAVPASAAKAAKAAAADARPLLIVGSINADSTITLERLPARGECITSTKPTASFAVGGKVSDPACFTQLLPSLESAHAKHKPPLPPSRPAPTQGANQAVAAARLRAPAAPPPRFVCRFGDDDAGRRMRAELAGESLDLAGSATAPGVASGTGIVWLDAEGAATSVVLGGANACGWGAAAATEEDAEVKGAPEEAELRTAAEAALAPRPGALLLQREIPEAVNAAFASAARAAGVPVLLDAGGEDSPVGGNLLAAVDYICPNELELRRLTGISAGGGGAGAAWARVGARKLMEAGARGVLVTLGEHGALLVTRRGGGEGAEDEGAEGEGAADVEALHQPAFPVPGGAVVDATAAGDAFRAAFATALVEGRGARAALRFAAAAGAVAVSRAGAMPSLPGREEVEALLAAHPELVATAQDATGDEDGGRDGGGGDSGGVGVWKSAADRASGGGGGGGSCSGGGTCADTDCPLRFASRLNSMRSRRDLVDSIEGPVGTDDVLGWVARQGRVEGLEYVYFNYPEHVDKVDPAQVTRSCFGRVVGVGWSGWAGGLLPVIILLGSTGKACSCRTLFHLNVANRLTHRPPKKVRAALDRAGLKAGGLAMRFPAPKFAAGAFTNPDPDLRWDALALLTEACRWAEALGAREVVVWSAFDGYDYHLQVGWVVAV
jgi:sugar/nucleoside kinase (ribokinase family)